MSNVRRDRIAKGQCPNCGKEAAPFYLCGECRFKGKVVRGLDRGAKYGGFTRERRKDGVYYGLGDSRAWDAIKWRAEAKDGDKRLSPRLRGTRVDVERTLVEIIRYAGKPCTLEEIKAAWGRLRAKRDTPLAADLARIIVAEDRRKAKAAKRLRINVSAAATATRDAPAQPSVPLAAISTSDG